MNYKTVLVHVDLSSHAPARMRYAAALAHAHHAHLLGAAMFGVSRSIFPLGYTSRPGTLEASYFDPLAQNATRALAQFEAIATEMRVPHEARFVCDQADDGLARLARFADLVVITQDDPDEALTGPDAGTAELESQRPDLLRFLGHHGITPHMLVRDPRRDPGHDLLDLAAELHCGLLVMGCFGHNKLRELCLGGASRAVLADARIPVLLAH